ncbi:MAG: hypothetical protein JKY37_33640 [Nannocystaceae bacterium]|nr:hypothetical protein [Nannocystaceae bacterium]
MPRSPVVLWFGFAAVLAAATGCTDSKPSCAIPNLPSEWECAEVAEISEAMVVCGAASEVEVHVSAVAGVGSIEVVVEDVLFRPQQSICTYLKRDVPGTAEVLIQPCDMDPEAVESGGCLYDFSGSISASAGEFVSVAVYRRYDNYGVREGVHQESEVELLGTVALD